MRPSLALRVAAERDLSQIADYSLTTHGWSAKNADIGDLGRALDSLIDFPKIGAIRNDPNGEWALARRCL